MKNQEFADCLLTLEEMSKKRIKIIRYPIGASLGVAQLKCKSKDSTSSGKIVYSINLKRQRLPDSINSLEMTCGNSSSVVFLQNCVHKWVNQNSPVIF